LAAAQDAAARAAQTQSRLAGQDQRFSLEHRGNVLSAIVLSVAFMEAAINEVFQDAAEGHITEKLGGVDPTVIRSWAGLWTALDAGNSGSALKRCQAGLMVAHQPPLDEGSEPWQSAHLLVQLRNHLVHFRPETVSQSQPQKLVKRLRLNVHRNPLSNNSAELDGWLSASCASWAVRRAVPLIEAFATRTGARPNYQLTLEDLRNKNP
jgi:hypothetical protein